MKITDSAKLKDYMRARGLAPKDYMGQNFLVDEEVLAEIINVADLKESDTVLEVGPGLGVLTGELVAVAKKVWAVEKDPKLFGLLKTEFAGEKKLKLVNEDILRFNFSQEIVGPYKVVANIPYYLTSKLMQLFLEASIKPTMMVLMVQKEVGERMIAQAGELSILGISIQIYANAQIAVSVSKNSFWPVPKVDSVVLKITPSNKYPEITDMKLFFRIIKMAFAGKRKMILNTMTNGLKIEKAKVAELLAAAQIEPTMRPQDIEIAQWIKLYRTIALPETKNML